MHTASGSLVYVCEDGGPWAELKGYAGGLNIGMSVSLAEKGTDDDGIARYVKGNSSGSVSQLSFRIIDDDPGQELVIKLCEHDHHGVGSIKLVRPQGGSVIASGLFHGAMNNPFDPDVYQGYLATFTQIEPETYE